MTKSNRLLNRIFLCLIGLIFIGIGTVAMTSNFRPELVDVSLDFVSKSIYYVIIVTGGVLIIAALMWIFTRGRGKTGIAYEKDNRKIDVAAIRSLFLGNLSKRGDVIDLKATGFAWGTTVLLFDLIVRKSANLDQITKEFPDAIHTLDAQVGYTFPFVIHISTGIRSAFVKEKVTN